MLSLIFLLFSQVSFADIQFDIVGPCDEKPLFTQVVDAKSYKHVGDLSIKTLIQNKIDHIGTEEKIESINGTPVGEKALEIVSRSEMRAYGWCFYVDSVQPEVYPHEVPITKDVQTIKWEFAYAHYKNGKWLSMCEPAWKIKPDFLCK